MENSHRFFKNRECKYFPCHEGVNDFNCLFCYCPLYHLENCPGNPVYKEKEGKRIKVCKNCTFPHKLENYDMVVGMIKKGLKESSQNQ